MPIKNCRLRRTKIFYWRPAVGKTRSRPFKMLNQWQSAYAGAGRNGGGVYAMPYAAAPIETTSERPDYSIDKVCCRNSASRWSRTNFKVIKRVHTVAGRVNELTHVATNNANAVSGRGETTIENFNRQFANVSSSVADMIVCFIICIFWFPIGLVAENCTRSRILDSRRRFLRVAHLRARRHCARHLPSACVRRSALRRAPPSAT